MTLPTKDIQAYTQRLRFLMPLTEHDDPVIRDEAETQVGLIVMELLRRGISEAELESIKAAIQRDLKTD